MKPTKHKITGGEWNDWIGKGAFFFLTTLIVLYGFFDITTSRQTYHIDYDRTASKILLLSIIIFSLFYCAGCLVTKKYRTKNFLDYFLSDYFGVFIISIACLIISDLISFFVNKVAFSVFSTTAIYYVLFISLSVFMRFWSFGNIQRQKTFLYSSLIIFFFYYFFILFYFFYIQGRPMSSGGLRIPVLSHAFFPPSLIPSLRLLLKRKIVYIYLLFFP